MKRWWGIRHLRWLWASWGFWSWWEDFGRHLWIAPNPADLAHLDRILMGEE